MSELLQDLSMGQGYLKAGFQGFQASGKTHTAMLLALAVRQMMGLEGPVAMFDTEAGSAYIGKRVKEATGKGLLGMRSRALDKLLAMARQCEKGGVSVLIVDSMTHIWREVCDAYLRQVNAYRQNKGWSLKKSLEFQDWGPIKAKFGEWTDFYLNSQLHIIICGRAGYEYDFDTNEEGKKELIKTGTKMKTEGEFGFEPSLLVEMELLRDGDKTYNVATILKDRFDTINGKAFRFGGTKDPLPIDKQIAAVAKAFGPHLEQLSPGTHAPIDTETHTDLGVTGDGDDAWNAEKKQRAILCEEIQGEILRFYPGQTAKDRACKAALIERAFATRSWTRVENMQSADLRKGLEAIREILQDVPGFEESLKSAVDAA